jgi:diguanylate cyclase (GGDEF)-like protein/PAS domain S-box-containing protein
MLNIKSLSWPKIVVSSIGLSLVSFIVVIVIHFIFAIETGGLASLITVLSAFLLSFLCLLCYIRRTYRAHTNIIKHILDSVSDVIVIKDYQGNFVFCNEAVARLYNSRPDDMVGKNDFHFTQNTEQASFFLNSVQSIMNNYEKQEVFESSTDAKTAEIRHFKSTKIPFRDMQNQLKILVMAKDITDIVRLKEEADRNKKRLEHVLEVSEEGLWEWNTTTNQVLHNKQWEIITGIEGSDNTFKEFENCILPNDRTMVSEVLEALVLHHKPYSIEFRMRRPDGKVIWIWDRGRVAEYDQDGQPMWLVGIALDITTEKENQQKIANLAYYDQLTGLANRIQLENELKNTIELSHEKNSYSALLFLDLDRFKLLNDSYGHHMGDRLLETIAQRLKQINNDDSAITIARFGGDEFVIVLPFIDAVQTSAFAIAQKYADRVITEVTRVLNLTSTIQDIDIEYSITGSIGGVVFKSGDLSTSSLLQLADLALYRAKAKGGNYALIVDVNMQDDLKQVRDLQQAMHLSISNRDFCIYLQPKYNIYGYIIGADALVRWDHPELGILSPVSFISMAEETNMIIPIGKMVLEQACEQLQCWQRSVNTDSLSISINLSAKQIWQSHFVEDFINVIESYDINRTRLIVEVTESVLIQDIKDAFEKLTRLKEYGISVSLDDFGTGYSSLSYLRSLPIEELKIDRSFINDVATDQQAHLLVKSVIDLANNFGLKVVAEGVEDEEQFELLKSLGIKIYQGFYFSRPITLAEMERLLASHE